VTDAGVALVTGASGNLGAAVCAGLRRHGFRVRALRHRRPAPVADEVVQGSVTDAAAVARACSGAQVVVHLAAVTHARSPRRYEVVNEGGTTTLSIAAERARVGRLVHVSTRAVAETGGAYSLTKLRAEEAVRACATPYVIVRLPEVIGGSASEGVDRLLRRALRGGLVPVVCDRAELSPVGVSDAAAAVVAAATSNAVLGRTLTLAGESVSMRELVVRAAAIAGRDVRIVPLPVACVAALGRLGRVLPLPLVPDQLDRLRAPKPEPTPGAWDALGLRPAPLDVVLRALAQPVVRATRS
jgi:NADH dehydrogenase